MQEEFERFKWTCLILLVVAIIWYYISVLCTPFAAKFNKFKGPPILPFIGCAYLCIHMGHFQKIMDFSFKIYGIKNARIWLLHKPYLISLDIGAIQKVLGGLCHCEKSEAYRNAHFFMGQQGIVVSPVNIWKKDRKLLQRSVKSSLYDTFMESFNRNSHIIVDILDRKFQTGKEKLDILEDFGRCSMDIVFETMLDVSMNIQQKPELELYEAFCICEKLVQVQTFKPWLKFLPFWHLMGYAKLQRESISTIRKNIMNVTKNVKKKNNEGNLEQKYLHLLYQIRDNPEDIFQHIVTIVAAGFETTSVVLNHTLFLLALNPEVQRKVHKEIQDILGNVVDFSLKDIHKLKYIDLVLKESMRILTPTPMFGRVLGCDVELDDGLVMPKGANWIVPTWHLMHDPQLYPQPNEFIPERFLPENSIGRSPYAFLSFSAGPRGCFGQNFAMMEMKVLLARIIQKFKVFTDRRMEDLEMHYGIVMHIVGGLPITLKKRDAS